MNYNGLRNYVDARGKTEKSGQDTARRKYVVRP